MVYKVYDLETQTKSHLKRKASPFCPDNYIVALGWKNQGDDKCSWIYNTSKDQNQFLTIEDNITLLVGFNLKFDLLWQWNNPQLQAFLKRGGKVWDCQYVEYLLSGQTVTYPDLHSTAPKYGGTKKIDAIKALWEEGVNTSEIDRDLLIDYLVGTEEEGRDGGDVGNTEKIFLGQVAKVKELGMTKAVMSRMDGLLATTEMEWNGIKVDVPEAKRQYALLTAEFKEIEDRLNTYVPELPEALEFNWGSITHKSVLMFGGTLGYKEKGRYKDADGNWARKQETEKHYLLEDGSTCKEPSDMSLVQIYKSGKNKGEYKTKNVKVLGEYKEKYLDKYFTFNGFTEPLYEWATEMTDAIGDPVYQTTDEVLGILGKRDVPFCKDLARYVKLKKEITTYFVSVDDKGNKKGMLTCVDPKDHIIHHNLHHVSTVTTRLSSGNPNMQNIPREGATGIKKLFNSRFGENGRMLEADYSQLEIVVQGVLTGDKQLRQDLLDKIDFHCKRVAGQPKYNITYEQLKAIMGDESHPDYKKWKNIRTQAKIFSFQRAYGAGAKLIAESTGMSVEEVNDLIVLEEQEYPDTVRYYKMVEHECNISAKPFRDPNRGYKCYKRGTYTAPTGCIYSFRSYDAPQFIQEKQGVMDTFSPTEIKNYPIQGTGGEIVQGICGKLFRNFIEKDNYGNKAFLVNTVHDCIWVDLHKDVLKEVATDVKNIMESVPQWFEQFGFYTDIPFPVEVEAGLNMAELTHV